MSMLTILFIAESAAVIGLLYILCLDKGMIFEKLGNIILKEVRENIGIETHNNRESIYDESVQIYLVEKEIPKWKKPLGACQTCTIVWCGVFTYILFLYANPVFILLSIVANGLLIFRKIA